MGPFGPLQTHYDHQALTTIGIYLTRYNAVYRTRTVILWRREQNFILGKKKKETW